MSADEKTLPKKFYEHLSIVANIEQFLQKIVADKVQVFFDKQERKRAKKYQPLVAELRLAYEQFDLAKPVTAQDRIKNAQRQLNIKVNNDNQGECEFDCGIEGFLQDLINLDLPVYLRHSYQSSSEFFTRKPSAIEFKKSQGSQVDDSGQEHSSDKSLTAFSAPSIKNN